MTQIRQWLEEMQQGRLTLEALAAQVDRRGAVGPAEHRRELDDLQTLLASGKLDPRLQQALSTKLAKLQLTASGSGAEDATRIAPLPGDDSTRIAVPMADDATRVSSPGAPPPQEEDDRTILAPGATAADPSQDSDATQVFTASDETGGRTSSTTSQTAGTAPTAGTSSGSRASTWKRLAEADGPAISVTTGTRLKDRFVLERQLGQGGMGVVYLALDERKVEARDRNPRVAVKVLNDEFRRHPDSLIALQRESRRSQQLAHDNIVRVYDFDKDGTIVFMTMEYVDGEDLKSLIRRLEGKGMPMAEAYPIIEGMGRALERAHRDGVVHSDFKPGNVMLTQQRVPKVFDFGIARAGKHRGGSTGEQTVFDASTLGALTPAYASLEMLQGVDAEPACDLYALSCVAYELLSGVHPFNKLNAEQAQKQGLVPAPVPGLSKLQWRTLCRGLAFQRGNRIATAGELIEGLRPRTQRERMLPIALGGLASAAVVALLVWGGTVFWYNRKMGAVEDCIGAVECADAMVLTQKLQSLKPADQALLGDRHRDEIKGIFHSSLAKHWAPAQARYDYKRAAEVVRLAFGLYGQDSAWVKELGDGLEASRNTALSQLNDEFTRQIDQDPFVTPEGGERGLLAILDAVRAIDPAQAMLQDGRIGPALERGVRNALAAPGLDAAQQLAAARKRFDAAQPYTGGGDALKPLASDLQARADQIESESREAQQLAAARSEREQRLAAVAQALSHAAPTREWRSAVRDAWIAAHEAVPADDADLRKQEQALASTLLAQSTRAQADGKLDEAADSARLGVELLASNEALAQQLKLLDDARNRQIAQAKTESERLKLQQERLDQLLQRPSDSVKWIDEVDASLKAFSEGADPSRARAQRETFARGIEQLVTQAIAAGDLGKAQALANRAVAAGTVGAQLAGLLERVTEARRQAQAKQIDALRDLAREKSFSPDWQRSVESSVAKLRATNDPSLPALLETLGAAYAERADQLVDDKSYAAARQVVDSATRVAPASAAVKAALARINKLESEERVAREQQQRQFKVEELERTVALKAAASELSDAVAALDQLRKLDPANRFAASEGPRQVAEGSLKLAERFAASGDFANAIKAADRGLQVLPSATNLAQARSRYESAACAAELDRETRKPGTLLAARKTECLALLKKQDPALYAKYRGLESTAVATPPAAPPESAAPAAAVIPPPPASVAESRAVVKGPDPCKKSFAGDGTRGRAQCVDDAGGVKGPTIVVVSGLGTFGITQTEVWYAEFARYCKSNGPCPPAPADGFLPVTQVSVEQARGYARWLSSVTGRRYRLPSTTEWTHAATVGGRDVLSEGYCKSESGGQGPHQITSGVMNRWGLVNAVGNVWELVDDGGLVMALGGSFQDDSGNCGADARKAFSGPDPAVGFRLVRELDD
ncbi:MAG: protein kinase domain-containing protein [Panacagrimonas sp.]